MPQGIGDTLAANVAALERRREEDLAREGMQMRIADAVTSFTGSMTFVYLHLAFFGAWIAVNLGLVPIIPRFDPTFAVLAMIASVEAIFLSTFVLITQNRMAAQAQRQAELDLHVSLLTEHELTRLAAMVGAIADKVGVDQETVAGFRQIKKDVAPEAVLAVIEDQGGAT
jgi:uncharacterized membrane protein